MSKLNVLTVYLNDYEVGTLTRLPDDRIHFHFNNTYVANKEHPVLSQSFYTPHGELRQNIPPTQTTAPPFFANLLPEGHLRDYLATTANIKSVRDFAFLELLGHDLPGAVILKPSDDHPPFFADSEEAVIMSDEHNQTILKFSLAGVQLKFSALMQTSGRLTIPAHGRGGEWIIKLPSQRFKELPENEFSMLELARHSGIPVPETHLVELSAIEKLPTIIVATKEKALVIKRFDRENGQRIHMEDFAQIYGVYPQQKYQQVSYNNIANMLAVIAGESTAREFIQRLIFTILIGNSDLHLKNNSLLYSNPRIPQLAPAYDYVATHVFLPDTRLALSIAGEKDMRKVDLALLNRFADKAKLPSQLVIRAAQETTERTVAAWHSLKSSLPLPKKMRESIEKRLLETASRLRYTQRS